MLTTTPRKPDWDTAGLFDGPVSILHTYLRTLEQRVQHWSDEMEPAALEIWRETVPMLKHLLGQITCDGCGIRAGFVVRGDGEFYCVPCDEARYTTCDICHRDLPMRDAVSVGGFACIHEDCYGGGL